MTATYGDPYEGYDNLSEDDAIECNVPVIVELRHAVNSVDQCDTIDENKKLVKAGLTFIIKRLEIDRDNDSEYWLLIMEYLRHLCWFAWDGPIKEKSYTVYLAIRRAIAAIGCYYIDYDYFREQMI